MEMVEEILPKIYKIYYGIDRGEISEQNKIEGQDKHVELLFLFDFNNYSNLNSNIGYLKEYFLTNFVDKYPCCKCQLSVYYKRNNNYELLSFFEEFQLMHNKNDTLYIIKIKSKCDCEYKKYKNYKNYMKSTKFDIISKLILSEKKTQNFAKLEKELVAIKLENKELKEEINKLKKEEEIKENTKAKSEDFYDIIIDINSIKHVNIEGWKINYNKKGLKKYNDYKNDELVTIGVLGNNNKGKSFLLSKISKIKLLSGTSIQTKGLSVKYPEITNHKGRQIILLDSAGLETPVLKKENKEKDKKEIKEDKDVEQNIIEDLENKEENKKDENVEKKVMEIEDEENNERKKKELKQNEEFKENARDKIMTELFLQNLIIEFSDILLVVVGKLTYSEQLLINKIKEECKNHNKSRMTIVHNLQEFRKEEQVENYIKESLLKYSTFNLKKRKYISTSKNQEENQEVNQDSEENKEENGEVEEKEEEEEEEIKENKIINQDKDNIDEKMNNSSEEHVIPLNLEQKDEIRINDEDYNDFRILHDEQDKKENNIININQNKEIINNDHNNQIEKKDVVNENKKKKGKFHNVHFTETLNYGNNQKLEIFHLILANEDSEAGQIYNQYAYNFIEKIYNLIPNPKKFDVFQRVKDIFKKESRSYLIGNIQESEFISDKKVMKLDFKGDLKLKKCFTDELGLSSFKTDKFEPKFSYFKPKEDILEIRLEIPGNTKYSFNHKVIGSETIVTAKGTKLKDNNPKNPEDLIGNREFSEFEISIPFKAEEILIKESIPKEGYPKSINGVALVQYELTPKGIVKEVESNDKKMKFEDKK